MNQKELNTVWKYVLEVKDGVQEIKIPAWGNILDIKMMNNDIAMWVQVSPENSLQTRRFIVYGTGHPHDNYKLSYVGTCLHRNENITRTLVWHIFEVNKIGEET